MTPRVSIITPVYNARRHLPATWRSIERQTFADWEWVVADDGSTDGSAQWLAKLAARDRRVRVVGGEPGRRPSIPRNRCLDAAGGELIALLDADDLWRRDKLGRQVALLHAHPATGVAYAWAREFFDAPGRRALRPPVVWPRIDTPADPLGHLLARGLSFCPSSLLIRRSVFDAVGCFNEELPAHDDIEFMLRVAAAGIPITRAPGVLVAYRIAGGAISSRPDPEKVLRLHEALVRLGLRSAPGWRAYEANHHLKLAEHAMMGCHDASPRAHLLRSLRANPLAPARWPLLALLLLPSPAIPSVYTWMKRGQRALSPRRGRAHRMVDSWGGG